MSIELDKQAPKFIPRPCGCKGIRTCLICEQSVGIPCKARSNDFLERNPHVYCPTCNLAWPGWKINGCKNHQLDRSTPYPGVFIQLDFLSSTEEELLIKGIDEMPWDLSQSGRRKQNFGPKCNFKKKRLRCGDFRGFPAFTRFVQEKFKTVDILKNFRTVEQCSLEYDPVKGASIDPHIDDCWVWGERIVTVNLLSDSVLTMTHFHGDHGRYNLLDVKTYPPVLNKDGTYAEKEEGVCNDTANSKAGVTFECIRNIECHPSSDKCLLPVVRIPMPRRSLLVLYGPARYEWEHCVLREDIPQRRICLAYREFTPPYINGGKYADIGEHVLKRASVFWDHKPPM